MRRLLPALVLAVILAGSFQACSSSSGGGGTSDGGGDAGSDAGLDAGSDGGADGGGTDGGTGGDGGTIVQCTTAYASCTSSAQCCSGDCVAGHCANPFCSGTGASCTSPSECCNGNCVDVGSGLKSCLACKPSGSTSTSSCTAPGECCSGICTGGFCADPGGGSACHILGDTCSLASDCCSQNCRNGSCVPSYSCQAVGDLCHQPSDCCSNLCSATGGSPGRCVDASGGCHQGGYPCSGGSNCCSNLCIDMGAGSTVCQPATGCRLAGDSCTRPQECCGYGVDPKITCSTTDSRCTLSGTSCQDIGLTCGAPVLPDGGKINAPQDCCDGHQTVCKVDTSGIPRCFGGCPTGNCTPQCPTGYTGQAGCCIGAGDVCEFKDQCCNGLPCLPDTSDGGYALRCTAPTCLPLGTLCGASADGGACCEGVCQPAIEGPSVCQIPVPPPDGGTADGGTDGGAVDGGAADGGADGGGICQANGTTCTAGTQCCSTLCIGGTCQPPQTCQPQGGACTATADCCTGFTCSITPGSSSGTCQPGSTCPSAGQQCSPTTPCCPGLTCTNQGTFILCTGTAACACIFAG
jgi:hypothetical protein